MAIPRRASAANADATGGAVVGNFGLPLRLRPFAAFDAIALRSATTVVVRVTRRPAARDDAGDSRENRAFSSC